jgi:hypothetical protein
MAVYVDELRTIPKIMWTRGWKWPKGSHMLADTVEELHAFAAKIGMRREWFQGASTPHYDLNESRYEAALAAGAVKIDRHKVVEIIHMYRAQKENDPRAALTTKSDRPARVPRPAARVRSPGRG